jgi:hypothetical protein
MNITLPIKSNNDYSGWVYTPMAVIAYKLLPALSKLLPSALKWKLHDHAHHKAETIRQQRLTTGQYPPRTWYGLNGVDQYDLWADSRNILSKTL